MTDQTAGNEQGASFRLKLVAAFAAVYLIWGSTYLAIRVAIETLPGFSMAGVRFLVAGAILYTWARLRGAPGPTALQWRNSLVVGGLLLLGGNGLVVWAEHFIPSGWAALLVGTEPLWVVLLLLLSPGAKRPKPRSIFAIVLGFAGVVVLTAPGNEISGAALFWPAAIAIPLAALSWAAGSVFSLRADLPRSGALSTGAQMLAGGGLLFTTGGALGEWQSFDLAAVSSASFLALIYLTIFGSLVAFSAYVWLIRNADPTRVATYAYVNPVVAVVLGWWLAGEPVGTRTLIAGALILGAVFLLSVNESHTSTQRDSAEGAALPAAEGVPPEGAIADFVDPAQEVTHDKATDHCSEGCRA